MLREELSMCCKIPLEVLKEYERWGLYADVGKVQGNWQYDDRDIRYLSVIMTLYDIGFEGGETETYMRLLLQGGQTADQRLLMLNQRRKRFWMKFTVGKSGCSSWTISAICCRTGILWKREQGNGQSHSGAFDGGTEQEARRMERQEKQPGRIKRAEGGQIQ